MSNEGLKDITFEMRTLSESQKEDIKATKEQAKEMLKHINNVLPSSRYASIAKTKLEEVAMFINKGISLR